MKRIMMMSAALILSATSVMAAISTSDIVAAFEAQGYTKIEVITGISQIKVEAVNGSNKIEVIYDAETGAILAQHSRHASKHDRGQGVVITAEDQDFLNDDSNGHDSDGAKAGEHGHDDAAGHDASDDHGKDGHGSDDNGSDHGGKHDHDSGSDHGKSGKDD